MQQRVFITQETNNIQIFHTTLTKWGSAQTSLVRVDLDVYIIAWLIIMAPDVEKGERYLLWKQELLIWGGEARAISTWAEHSYKQSAWPWGARSPRGEGCHKNSPDLSKPQRAADVDCNNALCRFSINSATTFRRLISFDTAFGSLPRRTSTGTYSRMRIFLRYYSTVPLPI